jgi:hypothetical protein
MQDLEKREADKERKRVLNIPEAIRKQRVQRMKEYNANPETKERLKEYAQNYTISGKEAWVFIKKKPELLNFIKRASMTDTECLEALKITLSKPPYKVTFSDGLLKKVIQKVRNPEADFASGSFDEELSGDDLGGYSSVPSKRRKTTSRRNSESTDAGFRSAMGSLSLQKEQKPVSSQPPPITQQRLQDIFNHFSTYCNTDQPFPRGVTLPELNALAAQLAKQAASAPSNPKFEKANKAFKHALENWKKKHETPTTIYHQPHHSPSQITATQPSFITPQQTSILGLPPGARPVGDPRSSNPNVFFPRLDLQAYEFYPEGPLHTYRFNSETGRWEEYEEGIQISSRKR